MVINDKIRKIQVFFINLFIIGSEITLNGGCKDAASTSFYLFLSSLSKLAIIMLYFYACDRYDLNKT